VARNYSISIHDNVIVKEAWDTFQGFHKQIHHFLTKQTENVSQLPNDRRAILKIQDQVVVVRSSYGNLKAMVNGIDQFVKTLPTKEDLKSHAKALDKALAKIQEVSTGLTVYYEDYKMSGRTTHTPRSVRVRPSYTHQDQRPQVAEYYYYPSSTRTQEDARQPYRYTTRKW
jgi:hypothetical protein